MADLADAIAEFFGQPKPAAPPRRAPTGDPLADFLGDDGLSELQDAVRQKEQDEAWRKQPLDAPEKLRAHYTLQRAYDEEAKRYTRETPPEKDTPDWLKWARRQVGVPEEGMRREAGADAPSQYVAGAMPFVSGPLGRKSRDEYNAAVERYKADEYGHDYQGQLRREEDARRIVRYEHDQQITGEFQRNYPIASGLSGAQATVSEALIGGALLGKLTPAISGGVTPTATIATGTAPQLAMGATRLAAQTALMPSMYLNGTSKSDTMNFVHAMILNKLLGSTNRVAGGLTSEVPTVLGRAGARGAVGAVAFPAEQQAADVATSLVDKVLDLPEAYRFNTKYGVLGKMARGEEADREVAMQMLMGAGFAMAHAEPGKRRAAAEAELQRLDAELPERSAPDYRQKFEEWSRQVDARLAEFRDELKEGMASPFGRAEMPTPGEPGAPPPPEAPGERAPVPPEPAPGTVRFYHGGEGEGGEAPADVAARRQRMPEPPPVDKTAPTGAPVDSTEPVNRPEDAVLRPGAPRAEAPADLKQLLTEHGDALRGFIERQIGKQRAGVEADDVFQQTMLSALESLKREPLAPEDKPLAWLKGIARNRIVDAVRAAERGGGELPPDVPARGETPADQADANERQRRLDAAINALDEPDKKLWQMSQEGKSTAEMAAELGKSEGAVRVQLSRLRNRLAADLPAGNTPAGNTAAADYGATEAPAPDVATEIRALYDRSGDTSIPMPDIEATLAKLDGLSRKELLDVAGGLEILAPGKSKSAIAGMIRQRVLDRRSAAQRANMIAGEPEPPAAEKPEAMPERSRTADAEPESTPLFSGVPIQITLLDGLFKRGFSVAKVLRKWFTSAGSLPPEVFEEKVRKDGRINAATQDVRYAEKDLKRAVWQAAGMRYAKLPEQALQTFNDALRGDERAMRSLAEPIAEQLRKMRDHVDLLSTSLIQAGAIEGPMEAVVDANLGSYLHRSYRVFDDPNWAEKVSPEVRNRAKAALREELRESRGDMTDAEVNALIDSLLYDGKAADTPIAFLARSKLGAKDLSTLIARKDVPGWLRSLWGEYEDPIVNYAKTVGKLSAMLANHEFLTTVREQGLGKYFFEQPAGDAITRISAEGSPAMRPLDGLFTTPEIKQAFNEAYARNEMPTWLRVYTTLNGLSKYSQTVGSIVTHWGNLLANHTFAVANGHWRVDKSIGAVKALFSDSAEGRAYWKRLTELGVVGEGVEAGQVRDLFRAIAGEREALAGEAVGMVSDRRILNWLKQAKRGVEGLYGAEDSVWKIYAFENEKARYQKAYPEWSAEQVETKAAQIVRDTYPTYSETPRAVRALRRFPLVGPFINFPAEVVRTAANTARLAATELADPRTRAAGAQRLVGVLLAASGPTAVAMISRYLSNVTKDEDEAASRFDPKWQENGMKLYIGRDEEGNLRYLSLDRADAWSLWKKPVIAAFRGDDVEGAAKNAVGAIAEPFVGEEMLAGRLIDVARNKQQGNGAPVYNPEAPALDRLQEQAGHVADVFEPGTVRSVQRFRKAAKGEVSEKTGRAYDAGDEALSMATGQRVSTLKPAEALVFKAKAFQQQQSDATRLLTGVAGGKGTISDQQITEAHQKMEAARKRLFGELHADALAAQKLGLSRPDTYKALRAANVSDENARAVIEGRYKVQPPDESFFRGLAKPGVPQALPPEEAARRYRLVRGLAGDAAGKARETAAK